MNKVKKFEISVVDRTYSKIVSNLVKFYSSDSALEVIFILAEEDYEFDSAELVLSNTDGSLITRPLTKVPEGYSYEFEENIISHYGEWKGQVVLHSGNNSYVSSKVVITIEDDLLSERPPKLTDVYSWTSLKRYADDLVGELKQAVLSVEGIEDTFNDNELERQGQFETAETEREKGEAKRVEAFNANETNRQSQFETAEQERQATFETNESERDETFNANETTRQTQELEREKAEVKRQTVFDGNEANRTETFNTNEATRQENETTRQQAESQRQSTFETNETERQTTFETAEQERQSAELIRVSTEEQRKTDHANRSAELAGKANKKQGAWVTPTLTNGWTSLGAVGYRKDDFGRVYFRGRVAGGTVGTTAFILPNEYKNGYSNYFASVSDSANLARVIIGWDGAVKIYDRNNNVSLDGISISAGV